MIYGFYFRINRILHNEVLSVLGARVLYFLFLIRFQMKRLKIRKKIVDIDSEEAIEHIKRLHPDNGKSVDIVNPEINKDLDLSIVVPVYNYVELIEKNILSVLNQKTIYRYELILVDDGSTDGARDVVCKYKDHPNVKVVLQENAGIAGARNNGINHASGKYLMFIDCDDTIHEDMVETLMSKAYEGDYEIVMCGHNLSKERNGQVYEVIPNVYPQANLFNYRNGDAIMNYAGLPWCKVYKREMWNKVRYFTGYWYEDTIIHFLLFSQCHKFAYVPKVCYEYRWYEKNFSHTQGGSVNPKVIDRYWMLIALIKKYRELGMPYDAKFYTLLLKHASSYYYNTIAKMDERVIEELFVLACDLIQTYRPAAGCKLPYALRITEKAMLERDINLWKLACRYQ